MQSLQETIDLALEGPENTKQVITYLYMANDSLTRDLKAQLLLSRSAMSNREAVEKALEQQLNHISWLARTYMDEPHSTVKGIVFARLILQAISNALLQLGSDIPF